MIKVSIMGATGYTGQELVRILRQHPGVELVGLGTQNYAGQPFAKVYPHFNGVVDLVCRAVDDPRLLADADVVFLAMPHGLSASLVGAILEQGKKAVDLGADFRLRSPAVYQKWYKTEGPAVDLLAEAVYGLPEINREKIKKARVVANPGCYPTTAVLGLAPLLKNRMIDPRLIIIDSKSGVSGAGRGLAVNSLFAETDGDFKAYGLPVHRHAPEIEQELGLLAGQEVTVTFTPHLLPMTRGMLSTIYVQPVTEVTSGRLHEIYREFYRDEPFVRVCPPGQYPHTKWVQGTNYCDIGLNLDERTGRITVLSAIDNLVKGASGQAVQNMNIMCGLEETLGNNRVALYP